MAYTDEEIATAVARIVRKEISVPAIGNQGSRDVVALKDQLYDLLTISILMDPGVYFYLIYLASNRLRGLLSETETALEEIDTLAPTLGRPTGKITSTTALSNARAALLTLASATSGRQTGGVAITVDKFRRDIMEFINTQLASTLVVDGDIQRTPEEVKTRISILWTEISQREKKIAERVAFISHALSNLETLKLPSTALQTLGANIRGRLEEVTEQMAADNQAQTREAFLDLMTMRSILTQATSFNTPAYSKFPLRREAATATQVDSEGLPASLTTTGPFEYGLNTTLEMEVYGASVTYTLPSSSRARLVSDVLSFPVAFGSAGLTLLDAAGETIVSPGGSYANGPDLVAGITPELPADTSVVWDASASRLTFYGGGGLGDFLGVLAGGSVEQIAGRELFFAFQPVPGYATLVPCSDVADSLNADTRLRCSSSLETLQIIPQTSGSDELEIWAATGSAVLSGNQLTGFDFTRYEVRRGMVAWVEGVPYTITKVEPFLLTLDGIYEDPVTVAFSIQEDFTGYTHVQVPRGLGQGFYTIFSVGDGVVAFDRDVDDVTDIPLIFIKDTLVIESATATTDATLTVVASSGALALGLSGSSKAQVNTFTTPVPFRERGVVAGDILLATSPSGSVFERVVASFTDLAVTTTLPVTIETGSWTLEVVSIRVADHQVLVEALDGRADISGLEYSVRRLIQGSTYTAAYQTQILTALVDVGESLAALDAYSVPVNQAARSVVDTFREQGLDRALDFLLRVDILGFFDLSADATSYSTHFMRTAATVTREVAPQNTNPRSQQGVSTTEN